MLYAKRKAVGQNASTDFECSDWTEIFFTLRVKSRFARKTSFCARLEISQMVKKQQSESTPEESMFTPVDSIDPLPEPAHEQRQPVEVIHAEHCVLNTDCTLTPGCRGRFRQTPAIKGQVQVYCPKCQKFAVGTRPANSFVTGGGGGKLFTRTQDR